MDSTGIPPELTKIFIDGFNALKSGDKNVIENVYTVLNGPLSEPISLPCLYSILSTHPDPYMRLQANFAFRQSAKIHWSNTPEETKLQYITIFFQYLIHEDQPLVRTNASETLSRLVSPVHIPEVFKFSRFALETNNPAHLHSSLIILSSLVGHYQENILSEIAFFHSITKSSLAFGDNHELILEALDFFFTSMLSLKVESNEFTNEIWNNAVNIIPIAFNSGDSNFFIHLIDIIVNTMDDSAPFATPEPLFPIAASLYQSPNDDEDIMRGIVVLTDQLCYDYPDEVLSSQLVNLIIPRYLSISSHFLNLSDELDISESDIFKTVCENLSRDSNFLESAWNLYGSLLESGDPEKVPLALLIALNCFSQGYDFFQDHLDAIVESIAFALVHPSRLISDIGSLAATTFCSVFEEELPDYAPSLFDSLLEALKLHPSLNLVTALRSLYLSTQETDDDFDVLFPVLLDIFKTSSDPQFRTEAISCCETLISYSHTKAVEHFSDIFNVMNQILSSNEPDLTKVSAISALTSLGFSAPEQFSSFAHPFAERLTSSLSSSEYTLINSSIEGLGMLLANFTDSVRDLIPSFFTQIQNFLLTDKEFYKKVSSISNPIEADFDFNVQNSENNELFFDKSMTATGKLSAMLMGTCLEECPDLIKNLLVPIAESFCNVIGYTLEGTLSGICKGISYSCIGLKKLGEGASSGPLLEVCRSLLTVSNELEDVDTISNLLEALAAVLDVSGAEIYRPLIEPTLTLLDDLLMGTNKVCDGKSVPEEVFDSTIQLFDVFCESYGPEIYPNLKPIIVNGILDLASHGRIRTRRFCLQLLTIFFCMCGRKGLFPSIIADCKDDSTESDIEGAPVFFPPNFISDVVGMAMDLSANSNDEYGFFSLFQFSQNIPQIIMPHIQKITEIAIQKLQMPKRKKSLRMLDNAVQLLAQLIMDDLGQGSFPVEQLIPPLLEMMPAKEDPTTNPTMLSFVFWICNNGHLEQFKTQILTVFIKLFGKSPRLLEEASFIESDILEKARKSMKFIFSQTPNADQLAHQVLNGDQYSLEYLKIQLSK